MNIGGLLSWMFAWFDGAKRQPQPLPVYFRPPESDPLFFRTGSTEDVKYRSPESDPISRRPKV